MKNILRHSIEVYVEVVESWALMGIFSIFIFWQQGQWSMKYRICCCWYYQVSFQSLKRLSVRSNPKWSTTVLYIIPIFEYWDGLGLYDSICRADKIYSGEYSFGESIMLLRQRRERESAISLSTPCMNFSEELNSLNATYHGTIIGLEASLTNNKFRWSVRIVKKRSRRRDC